MRRLTATGFRMMSGFTSNNRRCVHLNWKFGHQINILHGFKSDLHISNSSVLMFFQQAIEQSKNQHETDVVEKHRLLRMADDKVFYSDTFHFSSVSDC